jgi:hypothetical protein
MIYLYPSRSFKGDQRLLIYLKVVKTANMFEGWSRDVKLKLFVYNEFNRSNTIAKGFIFFLSLSANNIEYFNTSIMFMPIRYHSKQQPSLLIKANI